MTEAEARKLRLGIYTLHWDDGGSSLAAVGQLHDGTRWFAPINWTSRAETGIACTNWEYVTHATKNDVHPINRVNPLVKYRRLIPQGYFSVAETLLGNYEELDFNYGDEWLDILIEGLLWECLVEGLQMPQAWTSR